MEKRGNKKAIRLRRRWRPPLFSSKRRRGGLRFAPTLRFEGLRPCRFAKQNETQGLSLRYEGLNIKEAGQDEPHTQKPDPDPPVKLISQVKGKIRRLGKVNPRTGNPPENKDEGQHRIIADY